MSNSIKSKRGFWPIVITVFLLLMIVNGWLFAGGIFNEVIFGLVAALVLFITASIRIADQWEKGVVLRMGRSASKSRENSGSTPACL